MSFNRQEPRSPGGEFLFPGPVAALQLTRTGRIDEHGPERPLPRGARETGCCLRSGRSQSGTHEVVERQLLCPREGAYTPAMGLY